MGQTESVSKEEKDAAYEKREQAWRMELERFRHEAPAGVLLNDVAFRVSPECSWKGQLSDLTTAKNYGARDLRRGDVLLYKLQLWVALYPESADNQLTAVRLFGLPDDADAKDTSSLDPRDALRIFKVHFHGMLALPFIPEWLELVRMKCSLFRPHLDRWREQPSLLRPLWQKANEVSALRALYYDHWYKHDESDLVDSSHLSDARQALAQLELFGAYKAIDYLRHPEKYVTPLDQLIPPPVTVSVSIKKKKSKNEKKKKKKEPKEEVPPPPSPPPIDPSVATTTTTETGTSTGVYVLV